MKTVLSTYWRNVASGKRSDFTSQIFVLLLTPASLAYRLIQYLRRFLYQTGILEAKKLPKPVISIGNITVGGTGKTPITAYIAQQLIEQGFKVAVLSRGYGGSREGQITIVSDGAKTFHSADECGDEPVLLSKTVSGLMVVTGSDRFSAGIHAIKLLNPDVLLLDDGFQHIRLQRDLNILLLDYHHPYGNGLLLPAGLLREPQQFCNKADLIIHTRCPDEYVETCITNAPQCYARHELSSVAPLHGESVYSFKALKDKKIVAFAGIAEPQLFFDNLRKTGIDLIDTLTLPDHTPYDTAKVIEITDLINKSGADYAITTEKDGVKLQHLPTELADKILLAKLELIIADPATLKSLLSNLLQK